MATLEGSYRPEGIFCGGCKKQGDGDDGQCFLANLKSTNPVEKTFPESGTLGWGKNKN